MKSVILKTILPVGLIFAMTVPAVAASNAVNLAETQNAHINQVDSGIATNDNLMPVENSSRYVTVVGQITRLENTTDVRRITVNSDDYGEIIYNVYDETLVYSLDSTERVEFNNFKVGQSVSVFYSVMTPQTMSLPPQVNPEVIVIRDNLEDRFVKVDYFDENSISSDDNLKLNTLDSAIIVNEMSQMVKFEDTIEKNLIVFYTTETRSIPAQIPAVKIVVLTSDPTQFITTPGITPDTENNGEQVTTEGTTPEDTMVEGTVTEGGVQVEDMIEVIISGLSSDAVNVIDEVRYVQIAPVAAQLGFTVDWNPATALITLTKGEAVFTLTPGQTEYSYNRSLRYFDKAPFIQNDRTYVEDSIFTLMK